MLEQGPCQALPAHSVSRVSLSVVSTPGGLLPGLWQDCLGPRGRSSVLRGLPVHGVFPEARGWPPPPQHTAAAGRRQAPTAQGDRPDLSPVSLSWMLPGVERRGLQLAAAGQGASAGGGL